MRIVVLDIAASKTGALSVLKDFAAEAVKWGGAHEWIFIVGDKDYIGEAENLKVVERRDIKSSRIKRLIFEHTGGAAYISSFQPDVVFSLENTLPRGHIRDRSGRESRKIVYIHQPLGFQNIRRFSFLDRYERPLAVYQYLIAREIDSSARRADAVVVQTAWMKEAVVDKAHVKAERVHLIPPQVPDLSAFRDASARNTGKLFIYPAGDILYKNHSCVVEAVSLLNQRGYHDFRVIFTLKRYSLPWIGRTSENIVWSGSLDRQTLCGYYGRSVLLFPSYIETFGYPLAEAMQFGVPVLSSDTPASREVLKDYVNAAFFDPFSPRQLADLMEKVLNGSFSGERAAAGMVPQDMKKPRISQNPKEPRPSQDPRGDGGDTAHALLDLIERI